MEIDGLLDQIGEALEAEDISRARELIGEAKEERRKEHSWDWLRNNEPESYQQLKDRLELAREKKDLPLGCKTRLGQLIKVFKWCEKHGFELDELRLPENLHKYRGAAAYLNAICDRDDVEAMRAALREIRDSKNRDKARAWAQEKMKGEKERRRKEKREREEREKRERKREAAGAT
jgi:hypothetical protein